MANALDPTTYWTRPSAAELGLKAAYWSDPLPSVQGMLSSDFIAFYNNAIGDFGMISPFNLANLKAAAYELTLGPFCLIDGKTHTLTDDQPWLEIPQNSIVFVSMWERLVLPHYIAGRFDLAIEFIYKGILLGTGPQVDPGFQGVLGTPLHNISSEPVHIRLGYPFAKIDFTKTSGLWHARRANALDDIHSDEELYRAVLPGYDSQPVNLFKDTNRWREPIVSAAYAGDRRVSSSLADLDHRITAFAVEIQDSGEDINRLRRFGIAASLAVLLAVIAILVTLAQLDRSYTDSKTENVRSTNTNFSREIAQLKQELATTQAALRRLTPTKTHP